MQTTVAQSDIEQAKAKLDAHLREIINWHFSPETGCPFWLDWAKKAGWDPRKEINRFADMLKFPHFQDEWLRDLQPEVWVPKKFKGARSTFLKPAARPACRNSASAGTITKSITKSSPERFPTNIFRAAAAWLMVGPTGPRRLRLAIEHLANVRGSSCYFIDLDPRWVKKVIAEKKFDVARAYMDHVVDQAVTILKHREDRAACSRRRNCSKRSARRSICGTPASAACSAAARRWRRNTSVHHRRSSGESNRLLSDLRQHADGLGRERAAAAGG